MKVSISDAEFNSAIKLLIQLDLIRIDTSVTGTYCITEKGFVLKQKLEEKDEKFTVYLKEGKELFEKGDEFLSMLFFNLTKENWQMDSISFDYRLKLYMNEQNIEA